MQSENQKRDYSFDCFFFSGGYTEIHCFLALVSVREHPSILHERLIFAEYYYFVKKNQKFESQDGKRTLMWVFVAFLVTISLVSKKEIKWSLVAMLQLLRYITTSICKIVVSCETLKKKRNILTVLLSIRGPKNS